MGVQHAPEFAAALRVVTEYLSLSLGPPSEDFTPNTPFMDAGLDSLDLLKVLKASMWPLQGSMMLFPHPSPLRRVNPCVLLAASHVTGRNPLDAARQLCTYLLSAQLASLMSSELGVALPSTVAFDYPTVEAIVCFVLDLPSEVHPHFFEDISAH